MGEASKLLEDMNFSQLQLPTVSRKLTLNPPVVYGMINPSSVKLIDHVVNMVASLVELVDKVVDLIPYLVDTTLPLESETQAVDLFPPIDPILPLENDTQVVDLISLSVDPTLPLDSKPNVSHVFLTDTESTVLGGFPPSPIKPPPSNEAIVFSWGVLTGPHLPSHIHFNITVQFCGRDVPQMLIDEGSSISIFSSLSWQALGYPQLVPVNHTLFYFNREPVTL
jgi:hypothetical protein